MRGIWLIVALAAVLACGGCRSASTWGAMPGEWPNIECPQGSGITAGTRLSEIKCWANADGSPKALEAKELAEQCATVHNGTSEVHCQRVLNAWNFAHQVATHPELPPDQKEILWQQCVDELTHGPDG